MFEIGYIKCKRVTSVNFPASETIQDDSLTIREILTRFAGGQPIPSISSSIEDSYSPSEPDIDDDTYNIDLDDPYEVQNAIDVINSRKQALEKKGEELKARIAELNTPDPAPDPAPSE